MIRRTDSKRLFRSQLRDRKLRELDEEHTQRVMDEQDRHAKWMQELREIIRNHAHLGWDEDEG